MILTMIIYQSNQLNAINSRVSNVLLNFEEQFRKDEVFNLIEEESEDDAKYYDKKSYLEESKGKVTNKSN